MGWALLQRNSLRLGRIRKEAWRQNRIKTPPKKGNKTNLRSVNVFKGPQAKYRTNIWPATTAALPHTVKFGIASQRFGWCNDLLDLCNRSATRNGDREVRHMLQTVTVGLKNCFKMMSPELLLPQNRLTSLKKKQKTESQIRFCVKWTQAATDNRKGNIEYIDLFQRWVEKDSGSCGCMSVRIGQVRFLSVSDLSPFVFVTYRDTTAAQPGAQYRQNTSRTGF